MASPRALQNAVSKVLTLVGPMQRTSYLRTSVLTDGDELIGRGETYTNTDVIFTPQPYFTQLGKRRAMYLSTENLQLVGDDYEFIFPVSQDNTVAGYDVESFENPQVTILLKDENGTEYFRILYIDPAQYAGANVAVSIYARSMGHSQP